MDKFEELHKEWAKVPAAKQMKMDEAKKGECTCPKCPTYNNCAKNAKESALLYEREELHVHFRSKGMYLSELPGYV